MRPASKVATSLSVRADLIRDAKALGLNLSEVFEHAVSDALRQQRRKQWREENRDAIDRYNAKVARKGTFSDAWRKF
ncbi:MAG: type II toxin-antitoxin system CcdA family antitoxin [bacterium]